MRSRAAWAVAAAVAVAAAGGDWLDRNAPAPAADVSRGSEDAFASGLHRRELVAGQPPLRWTGVRARVRFERLSLGPARLELSIAGQRTPVAVVAGGVLLGVLAPGQREASYELPARRERTLEVELRSDGFTAGDGRQLGTQLRRVSLHLPAGGSGGRVPLLVAAPAAAWGLAALGGGPLAAGGAALAAAGVASGMLWRDGLLRSPWAFQLSLLLVCGAGVARAVAAPLGRARPAWPGSWPGWALGALGLAWSLQVVLATAPVMVVSDAVFHANKLAEVAGGALFPTSVTQHAEAFRIPYPALFYALLAPLLELGLDGVSLVRWGAGVSAFAAAAGLLWGLRGAGAALAGLSVVLLQLEPGSFDVHSFGNLSNVFAQSLTGLCFAWWIAGARSAGVGAALALGASLGHLSGLIVLTSWGLVLVGLESGPDRRRALQALGWGIGAALLYYAGYAALVLEQLPRLLEGGGQGRGASLGALGASRVQSLQAVSQWGLPLLALALCGAPSSLADRLDRALAAAFAAGAVLALLGVVSPLEVRYAYFLGLPLAVCGGRGVLRLWQAGRAGRLAAVALPLLQAALALANTQQALFHRYRG